MKPNTYLSIKHSIIYLLLFSGHLFLLPSFAVAQWSVEISSGLTYNHYDYQVGGHSNEAEFTTGAPIDLQIATGIFVSKRSELAFQFRHTRSINSRLTIADCNCSFSFESARYNRFSFEYRFHFLPEKTFRPYIGLNYGLHLASEKIFGSAFFDSTAQYTYFFGNYPSSDIVFNRPSFQSLGLVTGLNWSVNEWLYLTSAISVEATTGGDTQILLLSYEAPNYTLNEAIYHKGLFVRGAVGIGIQLNNLKL